jgi:hypothetical protein
MSILKKNYSFLRSIFLFLGIITTFQLVKNTNYFIKKFPMISSFESCSIKSSKFINVENINFEIIYLSIYPEIENIKCLLSVQSYYQIDNYVNIIYYSSPYFYLLSFIIFAALVFLLIFKNFNLYVINFLFTICFCIEVLLYNADLSYLLNTILFFIFIIYIKSEKLQVFSNNKITFVLLYAFSSTHLTEFLKIKFQLGFNLRVFFEILFLIVVIFIFNNQDNVNKKLKVTSFGPLSGILLLVFESLFFGLNQYTRVIYYSLFVFTILIFITNFEIKIKNSLGNLINSAFFVFSFYLFFGFINSNFFISKLFTFFIIFIIFLDIIKLNIDNRIFENKIFTLFIILFFLTQVNINDYFKNNDSSQQNINSSEENINVVHVLFDGLPGSVAEDLFDENKIKNFHIYSNFYSTAINTQPSISDMLYGSNFDSQQPFFVYYNNLLVSPDNYLNKLTALDVRTHLITDRFINSVIFQDIASLFDYRLINYGENEDLEAYYNFYDNQIPNIYNYKTVPNGRKVIVDYLLDILTIKKYDTNVVVERGALVGIDNLAKFYSIYEKNKTDGKNYYYIHVQIPHTPFVMNKDCDYIEDIFGDTNNSFETVNGHINCAKKLISILSNKLEVDNTLLIIHGDHSLDEIILDDQNFIKEKLHTTLLVRYPNFDYNDDKSLILIDDKYFTTDLSNLITSYYSGENYLLTNIDNNKSLNVVAGLAENYKNKNVTILEVDTSDW